MVELGTGIVNLLYISRGSGKKRRRVEKEGRKIKDVGVQQESQVQLREDRRSGMGMGEPKDSPLDSSLC